MIIELPLNRMKKPESNPSADYLAQASDEEILLNIRHAMESVVSESLTSLKHEKAPQPSGVN